MLVLSRIMMKALSHAWFLQQILTVPSQTSSMSLTSKTWNEEQIAFFSFSMAYAAVASHRFCGTYLRHILTSFLNSKSFLNEWFHLKASLVSTQYKRHLYNSEYWTQLKYWRLDLWFVGSSWYCKHSTWVQKQWWARVDGGCSMAWSPG